MGVGGHYHAPATLPPGKKTGTHCTDGKVGPQGQSGWVWKISPSPSFHPWTVQPIVSRDICFSLPLYLWNFPKLVQECKEIAEQFEVR